MTTRNEQPHALYRFFDAHDRLLYVGITLDLGARWNHHAKNKTWWTDVARCSVEHYSTREAVLEAEKAAIIAEKPRWNVVHNRSPVAPTVGPVQRQDALGRHWQFNLLDGRRSFQRRLRLYWELNWDSITDGYYVDEISPVELWQLWITKSPVDKRAESVFGPGARRVRWYVEGDGCFEGAPFQDQRNDPYRGSHFLDHYTWPWDPVTDERLIWSKLPVVDKLWRPGRGDKGGFIQELTGWKPSPLQPFVNVTQLEQMVGI